SAAGRAERSDGARERLQDGLGALERRLVPAHHDGERAVARALDTARDRAVEELRALRLEQLCRLPRGLGANGGAIQHESTGLEPGGKSADDLEHIGV